MTPAAIALTAAAARRSRTHRGFTLTHDPQRHPVTAWRAATLRRDVWFYGSDPASCIAQIDDWLDEQTAKEG